METLPGFDEWRTTEPENLDPLECERCGAELSADPDREEFFTLRDEVLCLSCAAEKALEVLESFTASPHDQDQALEVLHIFLAWQRARRTKSAHKTLGGLRDAGYVFATSVDEALFAHTLDIMKKVSR